MTNDHPVAGASPSETAIREQLELILASEAFRDAQRSSRMLRFLVDETLAGRAQNLKEYTLGVDVLERGANFDPRIDPIVRAEASRLRSRLDQYYANGGKSDLILFSLPKGSYVPRFTDQIPTSAAAAPYPSRRGVLTLVLLTLAALSAGLILGAMLRRSPSPPDPLAPSPLRQTEFDPLPAAARLSSTLGVHFALTPDGSRLVIVARNADGSHRLDVHDFATQGSRELPGTYGARAPFVSPDGQWVAFQAEGMLKRTRIDGTGSPIRIADAPALYGGSWLNNSQLVIDVDATSLVRLDVSNGQRTMLYDGALARAIFPQAVNNGDLVLYTALHGRIDESTIDILNTRTGERKTVLHHATFGRYHPGGQLTYLNNGAIYAVAFDIHRLVTVGTPVQLLNAVASAPSYGYAQFDMSSDGSVVYQRPSSGAYLPTLLDAQGATRALVEQPGKYLSPRTSPDGKRVAFTLQETSNYDIWTMDPETHAPARVTKGEYDYASPVWSMEGQYLFYDAPDGIRWSSVDGVRNGRLLGSSSGHVALRPSSLSPGNARLAYTALSPHAGMDIWTVPVEIGRNGPVAGKPEPFFQGPAFDVQPAFSPDGHWLAFGTSDSGSYEVHVRHFPDNGKDYRISDAGGDLPVWSHTGSRLFYRGASGVIMVAAVSIHGDSLVSSHPQPWSSVHLADTGIVENFDMLPGDKQAVALLPTATAQQSGRNLVLATGILSALAKNAGASGTRQDKPLLPSGTAE